MVDPLIGRLNVNNDALLMENEIVKIEAVVQRCYVKKLILEIS